MEHAKYLDLSLGLVEPKAPKRDVMLWLEVTFGSEAAGNVFLASNAVRYNEWSTCGRGDVVAVKSPLEPRGWFIAHISACWLQNGLPFVVGNQFVEVSGDEHSSKWRPSDVPYTIVDLRDIIETLIHTFSASGVVTVLHPFFLR